MGCFKAANHGLTPDQLLRIIDLGEFDLLVAWSRFRNRRFPHGIASLDLGAMDLVLLDSDAAGCVSTFIHCGELDETRIGILKTCQDHLTRVLPLLEVKASDYFSELRRLMDAVLARCGGESAGK